MIVAAAVEDYAATYAQLADAQLLSLWKEAGDLLPETRFFLAGELRKRLWCCRIARFYGTRGNSEREQQTHPSRP